MDTAWEPYIRNRIAALCDTPEQALVLLETLSRDGIVTVSRDDGSGRTPVVKGTEWAHGTSSGVDCSSITAEVTVFDDGTHIVEILDPQCQARLDDTGECGNWEQTSDGVVSTYPQPGWQDGGYQRVFLADDPAYWVRRVPGRSNPHWGWIATELDPQALYGRQPWTG